MTAHCVFIAKINLNIELQTIFTAVKITFVQFQPLLGVCKYGNGDVLSILEC